MSTCLLYAAKLPDSNDSLNKLSFLYLINTDCYYIFLLAYFACIFNLSSTSTAMVLRLRGYEIVALVAF